MSTQTYKGYKHFYYSSGDEYTFQYFTYTLKSDKIIFEYMYSEYDKSFKVDYKKNTFIVPRNYQDLNQQKMKNICSKQNQNLLYQYINTHLVTYAQNIVKNNKKQSCDWEKFDGYDTFKNNYFLTRDEKLQHYKSRFAIVNNQEDYEYEQKKKHLIIDLQNHGNKQIYAFLPSEKATLDMLKNPQQYLPEYESEDDYFEGCLYRKLGITKCLCGKMIDIVENSRFYFQTLLVQLKAIKLQNPSLYEQLKGERKDKVLETLQFLSPKLKNMDLFEPRKIQKNQFQGLELDQLYKKYKINKDQQINNLSPEEKISKKFNEKLDKMIQDCVSDTDSDYIPDNNFQEQQSDTSSDYTDVDESSDSYEETVSQYSDDRISIEEDQIDFEESSIIQSQNYNEMEEENRVLKQQINYLLGHINDNKYNISLKENIGQHLESRDQVQGDENKMEDFQNYFVFDEKNQLQYKHYKKVKQNLEQ